MSLTMWTYDLAREQRPSVDFLFRLCEASLEAGYDALGLYLEHRFAYPSATWAAGADALEPATVRLLRREFPSLRLIPFVNLLGHMEGFIYAAEGRNLAEAKLKGLQACPTNPDLKKLAHGLIDDVLAAFDDELVHIGGDETQQLGECPRCAEAVTQAEGDGKAKLYADYFGPLIEKVRGQGREVGIWGDMLLAHQEAMAALPKETCIFDWQYFGDFAESAGAFKQAGFRVVACPALHTYNAAWCHLGPSVENANAATDAVAQVLADGRCLTTWECALMGNYESILPAIEGVGRMWKSGARELDGLDSEWANWAHLMDDELRSLGGVFAFGKIRSGLKCRLLLYGNPFLAWLRHGEELCGEAGDRALATADQAITLAPNPSCRGVSVFLRKGIEFVRTAEAARQAYDQRRPGEAATKLAPARQIFEELEKVAIASSLNAAGSLADVERCRRARRHIDVVIGRIKEFGDGSLGYLPAWEILTHPNFMPHDQGNWWLINRWANE